MTVKDKKKKKDNDIRNGTKKKLARKNYAWPEQEQEQWV